MQTIFHIIRPLFWLGAFIFVFSCSKDNDGMGDVLVKSIAIAGEYITNGQSSQLSVVITPADATNKEVDWAVSDVSVATISASGLLTAVSNGNVLVTATAKDNSGVSASRWFGVSGVGVDPVFVTSIEILGSDITDGKAQQLQVEVLPANADNKTVSWAVAPDSVATISPVGLLTPKKNGIATVTASATDGSAITAEKNIAISGVVEVEDGIVVGTSGEVLAAIATANAGDKIYVRGGSYVFSSTLQLSRSGTVGERICLFAYPDDPERPLFDFSSMSENSSNRGMQLSGDYWYIKGIDVYAAGDNGMFIRGSHNIVEFCTFFENADSGLQIGNGGSDNQVINCDSYFNADSSIENADGFACKLDAGDGNSFYGCRAWQNLDDGWDGYLRGADNITTTYENCWAIRNGILKDGTVGGGDGNGFKTGGSDDKLLKHNAIYKNCVATGNVFDGFDHNSNRGEITILNCSAHGNGNNINFGNSNIAAKLTIKNTVTLLGIGGDNYKATVIDITNNSWQDGLAATSADFQSLDVSEMLAPRKLDGSLPDIQYLHLVASSDLIDKGVDVGLPFNGTAPDIGAFESGN